MKNILSLDDVVWGNPNDKSIKNMANDFGELKGFDLSLYTSNPPPKNSSRETIAEIEYIQSIPRDEKFIESADNVENYFREYIESIGYDFPIKLIKKLLNNTKPFILLLKFHYNRPRPSKIAKIHGMKLDNFFLYSMGTPSYPSGHSTQGVFISNVLADMFPEYRDELLKLGKDISISRLVSKAHYPSDSKFGEKLGLDLYKHWRNRND